LSTTESISTQANAFALQLSTSHTSGSNNAQKICHFPAPLEEKEPHNQHLVDARSLINNNPVASTAKSYAIYNARWHHFCLSLGIDPDSARPEHVGLFMKDLQLSGLAISTINVALFAVASNFKLTDGVSPTSSKLVLAAMAVMMRTAKLAGPGQLP
jgi:hypothetical protein